MQILWGPEYIQFYNDAYIPIAADKHPAGLGQRGAECWQEVWDFSGPMLDRVMATGEATWSEDQLLVLNRNGQPEEGYFTFSYSPIWDEFGKVGGIFIAVNETTQKILGERRERALRAEAQLAKETLENVLNTAPASISQCRFFSNHTYIVDYRSIGCESLTGYTSDELEAIGWESRVFSEDWDIVADRLFEAVFQQQAITVEYRFRHKDGSVRWIADSLTSHRDAARDCWIATMVGIDITPRKLAEEALRRNETALKESQERLQLALQGANCGTWDYDLKTQELIWSDRCKSMFGIDPAIEMTYELFEQAIHPDDRERVNQAVETAIAHQQDYDIEMRVVWADDTMHWVRSIGQVYHNSQGMPYRMAGVALDISNLKQTELALSESEERYRYLVEIAPQLVWTADPQGRNNYVSQQMCDYIGVPLHQLQDLNWRAVIHPDDVERVVHRWLESVLNGIPYEAEYRLRRADGVYRWQLVRAIASKNEQGQVIQWFGVSTDIHDKQELEAQRAYLLQQAQAAQKEAESANRMKDEFLAVLSHELRSPLNPILGWAKLLRMHKLTAERTDIALETIERNAKLQAQLIDDLLDVSRILRGKLALNNAPVSLVNVIQDALETVRSTAEAKGIQVQTRLDAAPLKVWGDSNRLKQVIWNLLSNAVKFTPQGGQVTVQLEYAGNQAQIQVSDTGKGIPLDFLPHVFDRFRQADSTTTRLFGGLGLGLAIAHQIVQMHRGTIQADSPGEGQGASFTVQLPVASENVMESSLQISRSSVLDSLQNVHVLVVEDDADSRDLIATTLQEFGAEVTTVPSAVAAITALSHIKPDILISDIGMPGMDGYMLMQQIREVTDTSQIPAIALTAYISEADQQKALAVGFQKHLAKPTEPLELVKTIAALISDRSRTASCLGGSSI